MLIYPFFVLHSGFRETYDIYSGEIEQSLNSKQKKYRNTVSGITVEPVQIRVSFRRFGPLG
jgi:hypothetical protein